ncbi:MAG: hypothetical protein ACR2NN_23110 [Bryobacteraceae bacterium]
MGSAAAPGAAWSLSAAVDFCRALLPALLPPAVYLGLLAYRYRSGTPIPNWRIVSLLAANSIGLLASSYPRWSANQLLFIAPVFYILAAWLIAVTLGDKARRTMQGAILAMAAWVFLNSLGPLPDRERFQTEAGLVTGNRQDAALYFTLARHVHPGDSLFVFPYFPVLYVLTNPTRYSFLQPGMMTVADEQIALAARHERPPEWVIYQNYSPEVVLKAWPGSDTNNLRLTLIESWIRENYTSIERIDHYSGPLLLLHRPT